MKKFEFINNNSINLSEKPRQDNNLISLMSNLDADNKIKNKINNYFIKINNNVSNKKNDSDETGELGKFLADYFKENKEKFENNPELFIFFVRSIAVDLINPNPNDPRKIVGLFGWDTHHEIVKGFANSEDWAHSKEEQMKRFKELQIEAHKHSEELGKLLIGETPIIKFIKSVLEKLPPQNAEIFKAFDLSPPVINAFKTNADKLDFMDQEVKNFLEKNKNNAPAFNNYSIKK